MLKISTVTPFARPTDTTPYASGDLVANSVTAGSVVPIDIGVHPTSGGVGRIRRTRLDKSGTGITAATFRAHFFTSRPTLTFGDNGPWLSTRSNYLGHQEIVVDKAFSDGASGNNTPSAGSEIAFDLAAGQKRLFALIEARGAYTPASAETFALTAEIEYEE